RRAGAALGAGNGQRLDCVSERSEPPREHPKERQNELTAAEAAYKRLEELISKMSAESGGCPTADNFPEGGESLKRATVAFRQQTPCEMPASTVATKMRPQRALRKESLERRVADKLRNPNAYPTMTWTEAASVFSRTPKTMYKWREDGKLEMAG